MCTTTLTRQTVACLITLRGSSFNDFLTLSLARTGTGTQSFQGESHEHPDYQPGDLVFRIKTIPHARFVRKENDLYMNATISLLQALVGFKKTYKHLDGHAITIERSGVTRPGA
jgi:DnaJ-class molecular chaperone